MNGLSRIAICSCGGSAFLLESHLDISILDDLPPFLAFAVVLDLESPPVLPLMTENADRCFILFSIVSDVAVIPFAFIIEFTYLRQFSDTPNMSLLHRYFWFQY